MNGNLARLAVIVLYLSLTCNASSEGVGNRDVVARVDGQPIAVRAESTESI